MGKKEYSITYSQERKILFYLDEIKDNKIKKEKLHFKNNGNAQLPKSFKIINVDPKNGIRFIEKEVNLKENEINIGSMFLIELEVKCENALDEDDYLIFGTIENLDCEQFSIPVKVKGNKNEKDAKKKNNMKEQINKSVLSKNSKEDNKNELKNNNDFLQKGQQNQNTIPRELNPIQSNSKNKYLVQQRNEINSSELLNRTIKNSNISISKNTFLEQKLNFVHENDNKCDRIRRTSLNTKFERSKNKEEEEKELSIDYFKERFKNFEKIIGYLLKDNANMWNQMSKMQEQIQKISSEKQQQGNEQAKVKQLEIEQLLQNQNLNNNSLPEKNIENIAKIDNNSKNLVSQINVNYSCQTQKNKKDYSFQLRGRHYAKIGYDDIVENPSYEKTFSLINKGKKSLPKSFKIINDESNKYIRFREKVFTINHEIQPNEIFDIKLIFDFSKDIQINSSYSIIGKIENLGNIEVFICCIDVEEGKTNQSKTQLKNNIKTKFNCNTFLKSTKEENKNELQRINFSLQKVLKEENVPLEFNFSQINNSSLNNISQLKDKNSVLSKSKTKNINNRINESLKKSKEDNIFNIKDVKKRYDQCKKQINILLQQNTALREQLKNLEDQFAKLTSENQQEKTIFLSSFIQENEKDDFNESYLQKVNEDILSSFEQYLKKSLF